MRGNTLSLRVLHAGWQACFHNFRLASIFKLQLQCRSPPFQVNHGDSRPSAPCRRFRFVLVGLLASVLLIGTVLSIAALLGWVWGGPWNDPRFPDRRHRVRHDLLAFRRGLPPSP